MDDPLHCDVCEFVATLAKSQQKNLAAAGTFVDIEELTAAFKKVLRTIPKRSERGAFPALSMSRFGAKTRKEKGGLKIRGSERYRNRHFPRDLLMCFD